MKKGLLAIYLGVGFAVPQAARADLFSDIGDIVSGVVDIVKTYNERKSTLEKLRTSFNLRYIEGGQETFEEFVNKQTLAYAEIVQKVAIPISSIVRICYSLLKMLSNYIPSDAIKAKLKQGADASGKAYESMRALLKGAQTLQKNLEELHKKMKAEAAGQTFTPKATQADLPTLE
jgi:hypothetical protein